MRLFSIIPIVFLLCSSACAAELLAARADFALKRGSLSWRVWETSAGLGLRYSDNDKSFTTEIAGAAAAEIRAKIAALRLSQRDIAVMDSRDQGSRRRLMDGVTYTFIFRAAEGLRAVTVRNPLLFVGSQGSFVEADRLRKTLALLDDVTRLAKRSSSEAVFPLF